MILGKDLQEREYLLVLLARYCQAVVPHARKSHARVRKAPPVVVKWLPNGCELSLSPAHVGHASCVPPPRPCISYAWPAAMDKPQLSFHQAVYKNEIETVRTMLQRDPKRARLTAHLLAPASSLGPSPCLAFL